MSDVNSNGCPLGGKFDTIVPFLYLVRSKAADPSLSDDLQLMLEFAPPS